MLVGKFPVKLDSKNRIQVPLRLREAAPTAEGPWSKFYLAPGPERCIFVFPPDGWRKLMMEMGADKALPDERLRLVQRFLAANAEERDCDKEGRIVLSEELQRHAGITQDALWVGAVSRAEIWNRDEWVAYNERNAAQLGQGIDVVSRASLGQPKADPSGRGPLA